MAINEERIRETQQVFNMFYNGFVNRHEKSVTGVPKEVIAGWLNAAATMTLAYYTDGAGLNVAGEIRDAAGNGGLFDRNGVMR